MSTITITDVGKINKTDTAVESDIVNGSSTITLYHTEINYSIESKPDNSSEITNYRVVAGDSSATHIKRQFEIPTATSNSLSVPKIQINGLIDVNKTSLADNGVYLIGTLNRLCKTKGLKKIYDDVLIKYLTYEEAGEVSSPGVWCIVSSFKITHSPTGGLNYQLEVELV